MNGIREEERASLKGWMPRVLLKLGYFLGVLESLHKKDTRLIVFLFGGSEGRRV